MPHLVVGLVLERHCALRGEARADSHCQVRVVRQDMRRIPSEAGVQVETMTVTAAPY